MPAASSAAIPSVRSQRARPQPAAPTMLAKYWLPGGPEPEEALDLAPEVLCSNWLPVGVADAGAQAECVGGGAVGGGRHADGGVRNEPQALRSAGVVGGDEPVVGEPVRLGWWEIELQGRVDRDRPGVEQGQRAAAVCADRSGADPDPAGSRDEGRWPAAYPGSVHNGVRARVDAGQGRRVLVRNEDRVAVHGDGDRIAADGDCRGDGSCARIYLRDG